jgi:hypothetical protein
MKPKNLIFLSLVLLTSYASFASALINPGDTLNPVVTNPVECPNGPTDPTCIVTLPTNPVDCPNGGLTATGSNVQLGGALLHDTTLTTGAFNLGINNPTPNATLDLVGSFRNTKLMTTGDLSFIANDQNVNGSAFSGTALVYANPTFTHPSSIVTGYLSDIDINEAGMSINDFATGEESNIHIFEFSPGDNQQDDLSIRLKVQKNKYNPLERALYYTQQLRNDIESTIPIEGFSFGARSFGPMERIFSINTGSVSDSVLAVYGNNRIQFNNAYTFPLADGLANQVLTTDGAGQLSWQNAGSSSAWSLTGNAGTTAGTNFIGTTDAQDFMIKTNGNQIALFGQQGNIAFGSDLTVIDPLLVPPTASNAGSVAFQSGQSTGFYSTAFGLGRATESLSVSWGFGVASGADATAWGGVEPNYITGPTAIGYGSTAFGGGTIASARYSTAFGEAVHARSFAETVFGSHSTDYISQDTLGYNTTDRLLNIGNGIGVGFESDALTILKSGQTGIAIDNFETNSNGNIFQVGDGSTGIIGYVDNGTGNWVAVSDERKKDNITDLTYGLNELMKLRPTSFNYKRNNEHTIGFLAQQVLPIIPEAVYGTESEGYGMSYATLTPVIVKAIQEMNLNITSLSDMTRTNTWRDSLIAWFGNAANGIRSLVVHDKICVDDQCLTKDDIKVLLEMKNGNTPTVPNNPTPPSTPDLTPPSDPLTCTAPQVINQAGDACVDPVVETPQIYTPPSDPLTE